MASSVLSASTFDVPLLKYLRNCMSCFKSPKDPSACILRFVLKRIPSSERIRFKSSFLCFKNVFATWSVFVLSSIGVLHRLSTKGATSKQESQNYLPFPKHYVRAILAGRFHTDFRTVILCKPITQFLQSFGKGRETSLFVIGSAVWIGDANASVDPGFVDIKSTAVKTKNFERQ